MDAHDLIDRFFAADGPLSRRLSGYAPRAEQVRLSHRILSTLQGEKTRAAFEAGTGIGKSLAYLAAALAADKRVLIATGTKALQEQLYERDVPLAVSAFRELVPDVTDAVAGERFSSALVKGRQNYLCLLRWERFDAQPAYLFPQDAAHAAALSQFASTTKTGDRAEIASLPDTFATWRDLDAGSESCIGQRCPHYENCFVVKLRKRAETARVIVANHHLLCADLRLRFEMKDSVAADRAWVLPQTDAIVVDEAHQFPDTAGDSFGAEVTSTATSMLVRDLRRFADRLPGDARAALLPTSFDLEASGDKLWKRVERRAGNERQRLRADGEDAVAVDAVGGVLRTASEALALAIGQLGTDATLGSEADALRRRVDDHGAVLQFVFGEALVDDNIVVVCEKRGRGVAISALTVDTGSLLQRTLLGRPVPLVFVSATLAVGGTTRAFRRRIGMEHSLDGSDAADDDAPVPSPFAFATRAALYCPAKMPEPDHASYGARFLEEARFLLELSRGGALFLFTSRAAMERGYEALLPDAQRLGVVARMQGDAPKSALLDEMRAADGDVGMLLCATHSFWEGVDVRGRALRLVVIDRLPFSVPSDPVQRARADAWKRNGGDPFRDLSLPEAALSLKQGAGRLLRADDDAGVVAVLDGRVRTRPYGRLFLDTLPPFARIGGQRALRTFWNDNVAPVLHLPQAADTAVNEGVAP